MLSVLDLPLTGAIKEVCSRFPERVAALSCDRSALRCAQLTYRQLDEWSAKLALDLLQTSVMPDEPVVVFVSNVPLDIVLLFAIWRSSAVAVPLQVDTGPDTIGAVLARTGARLLLFGDHAVQHPLPPGRESQLEHARLRVLHLPAPEHREILQGAALVMFTSGSTGTPKGVVLSRKSLMKKLKANDSILRFPEGVRSLLVLKLSFAFGQWVSMLTLFKAGTLLMAPRFNASDFLYWLHEYRIEQVAVVPTMLRALLNYLCQGNGKELIAALAGNGLSRLICTGGEPLAPAVASQVRSLLPNFTIADVFGLTETCTSDFILAPEQFDQYLGSIGFPGLGVEFRIIDQDTGNVARNGEVGELEIKTPFMMNGYLGEPLLTQASFHDQYFRTGDLARQGAHGEVYLAGRWKDMIVRGGNKVSPIEVDAVMMQHPQIAASLTTGVSDSLKGECIHTLVVIRGESSIDPEALRSWARTRLDKFKVPDRIYIGTEIPQGTTGKDDRRALHTWLISNSVLHG